MKNRPRRAGLMDFWQMLGFVVVAVVIAVLKGLGQKADRDKER